jgi:hypothetical protein
VRSGAPFLLAFALGWIVACSERPSRLDPTPIEVRGDPGQRPAADPQPITLDEGGWEWTVTPRAEYIIQGVVVGRERYRFDFNAKLSPCDIAIAWGPLVGHEAFDGIEFSQSGRFYFWHPRRGRPVDPAFVARFSSNTHIVPARPGLGRIACAVRPGQRVALAGDLVTIEGRKGDRRFRWASSLTRNDSGDGSCEILYLRRIRVDGRVYD